MARAGGGDHCGEGLGVDSELAERGDDHEGHDAGVGEIANEITDRRIDVPFSQEAADEVPCDAGAHIAHHQDADGDDDAGSPDNDLGRKAGGMLDSLGDRVIRVDESGGREVDHRSGGGVGVDGGLGEEEQ